MNYCSLPDKVMCRECSGRGYRWPPYRGGKPVECSLCGGTGKVEVIKPARTPETP